MRPSFFLTLGAVLTFAVRAQDARPALDAVGQAVRPFVEQKEVAGAVAAVFTADRVPGLNKEGAADLESGRPMASDTLFWIASMTKPITAMAVMNLRDEGKLQLDDPVGKYLPAFAAPGAPAEKVTIRQLLTHTSGLADAPNSRSAKSLAELAALYPAQPLKFPSGSQWEYCNPGINTLGRLVEVVSGKEFAAFLDERFFRPLGMKDTTFHPNEEQASRLARTYKKNADGSLEAVGIGILFGGAVTPRADSIPYPAGGLFSTADDLITFYQMVLAGGEAKGWRYISEKTLKEMAALHSGGLKTGFTPGASWGLGWSRVAEPQGVTAALSPGTFGHGGAYGTQIWLDPVQKRGYLLLIQRSNLPNADGSDIRKAFQDAAAAALGQQP